MEKIGDFAWPHHYSLSRSQKTISRKVTVELALQSITTQYEYLFLLRIAKQFSNGRRASKVHLKHVMFQIDYDI